MTGTTQTYEVELPAGGRMRLFSAEEVELFEKSVKRYREDYALNKLNDLMLVGAIVTQQLIMFRSQQRLAGMEPELDGSGQPTGQYKVTKVEGKDLSSSQGLVTKCAEEIRKLEQALGVDKKTREAGGQHTVANFVTNLKRAAHQYGVRIAERVKEYERVMMEARWRLRVLQNADAEDRAYYDLTPEKFCDWLRQELAEIEVKDQEWAKTKGKLYQGKL